jgi:hypothetical protein
MQHSGGEPTSLAVAAALLEASPPSSQLNAVAVDAYARCSSRGGGGGEVGSAPPSPATSGRQSVALWRALAGIYWDVAGCCDGAP